MAENSPVFYKSSRKVSLLKFLPLTFAACFTGLIMAVVLLICDGFNFYYFIFVPLIVAAPVYGMLFVTIHFGACRNRLVAILCTILCICVYYVGYWTLSYVVNVVSYGPEAVKNMENVAGTKGVIGYFIYRCKTNIITDDTYKQNNKKQPDLSDAVESYIFYSAEMLLLLGLAIAMGVTLPARVFFEKTGKWAKGTEIRLIPQELAKALDAIKNNNWSVFATIPKLSKIGNSNAFNPFICLKFEYLKNNPDTQIYVSLTGANMSKIPVAKTEGAKGPVKAFIKQMLIDSQFYPEIAWIFPELELGIAPTPFVGHPSPVVHPASATELSAGAITAPATVLISNRPQYSPGFAGVLERIGFRQPQFIGPDFRDQAAEASKQVLRKAGELASPADINKSICLPVPEDEKINPQEVSGINYLALLCFFIGFFGGLILLVLSEHNAKKDPGMALTIAGTILLISSLGLLFYGLAGRSFRAKHKLLGRPNALFDSFSNQKKEILRIEDPQSYHIHKRIPEDVCCCLFDRQNSRLLLEGCNYRYIIKGEDVTRIEPLESGQVVSIHLAYRINDLELGLIIYKQSTGGTVLNPLLTMNAAKSFAKKIRQTLNIKET